MSRFMYTEEQGYPTVYATAEEARKANPAFLLSTMVASAQCLPCEEEFAGVVDLVDAVPVTAVAPSTTEAAIEWEGVIGIEGELTGDGRIIEPDALVWDSLPMPLRWAPSDFGAHDGAQVIGRIHTVERRDGGLIWATGDFDTESEHGREAARQVAERLTNGVSMDLDDVSFEVRVAADLLSEDEAEEPESDEEGRVTVVKIESDTEVMATTSARLRAATIVSLPAFERARIYVKGEADAEVPGEDGGEMARRAGGRGHAGAGTDPVSSLVAAGSAARYRPPAEWFANPHFTGRTPLRVEDDGRVYGHLAEWGTCHTSHTAPGQCVLAPRSATDYAYFKTGYVVTAEGTEIAVGRLTTGVGHAGEALDVQGTLAHYDNSGTVVAFVTVGEDSHGIWVAGALAPMVTDEQRTLLRVTPLSGDWRSVNGNLELVAALAVNTAGFPIPRPKGMVAAGHMRSLVAAGMVAPTQVRPNSLSPDDLKYLKRLAQREREHDEEKINRVHAMAMARRVERSR